MDKKILQIIPADGWSVVVAFGPGLDADQSILDVVCFGLTEEGKVECFVVGCFGEPCLLQDFCPEIHSMKLIKKTFTSRQDMLDFLLARKTRSKNRAVQTMNDLMENKAKKRAKRKSNKQATNA